MKNTITLVSMSRILDYSHLNRKVIHLVTSVFSSENLDLNILREKTKFNKKTILFNFMLTNDLYVKEYNSNLIEIKISLFYFLIFGGYYRNSKVKGEYSLSLQSILFGSKPVGKLVSLVEDSDIDVYFLFQNISWFSVKMLFSKFGYVLSSGSTTRRHILSVTDFKLFNLLNKLNLNIQDIYHSYTLLSSEKTDLDLELLIAKPLIDFLKLNSLEDIYNIESVYMFAEDAYKTFSVEKEALTNQLSLISDKSLDLEVIKTELDYVNLDLTRLEALKNQLSLDRPRIKRILKYLEECDLKSKNQLIFKLRELYIEENLFNDLEYSNLISKLASFSCKTRKNQDSYDTQIYNSINKKEVARKSANKTRKFSTLVYSSNRRLGLKNSLVNSRNDILKVLDKFGVRSISLNINNNSTKLLNILYTNKSKEEIQLDIERFLHSEQNSLVLNTINNSKDSKLNFSLLSPQLTKILLESKDELNKLYKFYVGDVKDINNTSEVSYTQVLNKVGFEFCLNIMLGRLFKIISFKTRGRRYYTDICIDLGRELINRYDYLVYLPNKENYNSFAKFKLNNPSFVLSEEKENPKLALELGKILIGFLIELKLLDYYIEQLKKTERHRVLTVGSRLNSLVDVEGFKLKILPNKLPMICPPKKYDKNYLYGGYLLNDDLYTEELFIPNHHLVENTKIGKINIIYNMVNNLNSVSFSINREVLEFILDDRNKELNLIIDVNYRHPLENKNRLTLAEKRELDSFQSKKFLESEILSIANIFKDCSDLYFPIKLDYRGRIYCNTDYLNYQGVELAKSLLIFSKGSKVKVSDNFSIQYLKIYGANSYGNGIEKLSFVDRINWIDSNISEIINFKNKILLSKAESKLLFLAFCFEFNKYIEAKQNNIDYFVSDLPIQLDATCNGFQHLSMLIEDITMASKLNLSKSTWNDKPEDFYSFLTLESKEFIKKELLNNRTLNFETKESYERLLSINYQNQRSLVKKTIMTVPYNATTYANISDMKNEFKFSFENNEKLFIYTKDKSIKLKSQDFVNLSKVLHTCIYTIFPRLEAILNYFKEIAIVSHKLGIAIPWVLPSGLIVTQRYYKTKTIKVKAFLYSKDLLNLTILDKKQYNSKKQITALMPNLVHSLDAASLALLIDRYFNIEKNVNFFSIHDCFVVTCDRVHLITQCLKLSYYQIYCEKSFLNDFDTNFRKFIENQLGKNVFKDKFTIEFMSSEDNKVILNYPDVSKVKPINKGQIDFTKSSYTIT